MFTQINDITDLLTDCGYAPEGLVYIQKGVMTDKYSFRHADKEYIIRCYPKKRSWLAEVEFHFMNLLQDNGVKCPHPVKWNSDDQAYLLYEKLSGSTLGEVYGRLTEDQKESLCKDIVTNYNTMVSIPLTSYGFVKAGNSFSHSSWIEFIKDSINDALVIFKKEGNKAKIAIGEGLLKYSEKLNVNEAHLVWSDFSANNIIVSADGQLAGFIDFEGLMAGDPLLGLGYLIAHETKCDFVSRIIRLSGVEEKQEQIDFYAVIRYCRLLPYVKQDLPNGERRMPIESFLSYAAIKMLHFSKHKGFNLSLSYLLKWIMLPLTVILTVLSICCLSYSYHKTLEAGKIYVRCSMNNVKLSSNVPVWFSYNDTVLITNRPLDNEDVALLRNLVNDSTAQYPQYLESLNQLAFLSNTTSDNMFWLLLLTLCFVQLGCVARTMYDFIGWTCYKGGQDMERWWSWYLFRPVIGVPIASLLLVAVRTSLFSGLFTSRDLNTYLVISFLAGFSIMEFLKMLRRVSKTLFDGEVKSA